jgi:hypothetical protein
MTSINDMLSRHVSRPHTCRSCCMPLREGEVCKYATIHFFTWLRKRGHDNVSVFGGPFDGAPLEAAS